MKKAVRIIIISLPVLISACTLLLPQRFCVTGWTPGEDSPVLPEDAVISLTFNRPPEQVCTEEAFSLTAEEASSDSETSPAGRFSWKERTMIFTPYNPLPAGARYEIRLGTGAADKSGNSLAEDFTAEFRTGPESSRPSVVSIYPADNTSVEDLAACIRIVFDRPVDFGSVLDSFSCSPQVTGISTLDATGKVFNFSPAEELTQKQEYIITLSVDLRSLDGYRLAAEFSSRFTAGSDDTAPETVSAAAGPIQLHPSPPAIRSSASIPGLKKTRL